MDSLESILFDYNTAFEILGGCFTNRFFPIFYEVFIEPHIFITKLLENF